MISKKHTILIALFSTIITVTVAFKFGESKTFFVKNSAFISNSASETATSGLAGTQDTQSIIVPTIKTAENITDDVVGFITRELIDRNNEPKAGELLPGPGVSMPNPDEVAKNFIQSGLKKANDNILNVGNPNLKVSNDNSKDSITAYLSETQEIINSNLKISPSLMSIFEELNKNDGAGFEQLYPVINAYELAASQIEAKPVSSNLKVLISEEIRMLKITANILKSFTNIETDPLAAIAAAGQFKVAIANWQNLQEKFNRFTQKINQIQ